MKEHRQHRRQTQGRTNGIAMRIAKFGTLEKSDVSVRPVDISAAGMGVEADALLEPGFVWFRDNVGHHRSGVVVWTKRENNTCRAGIKFIPLGPGREVTAYASAAYLYLPSCGSPQLVACMLVDEVPVREG